MISINIKIHVGFQKFLPPNMTAKRFDVSLQTDCTLDNLLTDTIGLPADLPKLIFVNGIHAMPSDVLKDHDRVSLFMPSAGG